MATLTVFASVQASGIPFRRGGATLAALSGAGGGTEAFAVGASFVGFFVFVTSSPCWPASSPAGRSGSCSCVTRTGCG